MSESMTAQAQRLLQFPAIAITAVLKQLIVMGGQLAGSV